VDDCRHGHLLDQWVHSNSKSLPLIPQYIKFKNIWVHECDYTLLTQRNSFFTRVENWRNVLRIEKGGVLLKSGIPRGCCSVGLKVVFSEGKFNYFLLMVGTNVCKYS
jgi:hypothetical protein